MWTFGGTTSKTSSSWKEWQDPPKTPRPRSKSRSRGKGKAKGGKSKQQDDGYSGGDGGAPWRQSSSVLETLGIPMPDATASKSTVTGQAKDGQNMEQVLSGLRNHLKSLGQEVTPEVEAFLLQKAGNKAQAIRVASQKLEASQKATTKLHAEINQQKVQWKKFQDKISEEYEAQLTKYKDRMTALKDALRKAGEEYSDAKKTLQEAANEKETPELSPKTTPSTIPVPPKTDQPPGATSKSPKRKALGEQDEVDPLAKHLKTEVDLMETSDEELQGAEVTQGFP